MTSQPLAMLRFDSLLESVAAKAPTPGGGAVASAVGALSAALAGMVVSYSVGKKNLAAHEPALQDTSRRLTVARALLLRLADEDSAAYGAVNELSKLPETDPRRATDLAPAVLAAVQVPMAVLGACADLLRLMESLAGITNRRLRSDLAIAAVLAEATARSSRWNVAVNAASLPGRAERESTLAEAGRMVADCAARCARVEAACADGTGTP